jgi:hypothetical protein
MMDDPIAFEQMRKDAPTDRSFGSIEDLDDQDEPADWWKAEEPGFDRLRDKRDKMHLEASRRLRHPESGKIR